MDLNNNVSGDSIKIDDLAPASSNRELSFGEKACDVSFNPSRDPVVDEIKKKAAELIDLIAALRSAAGPGEKGRYYSKAISHIEDGQMNAVKAATWQG